MGRSYFFTFIKSIFLVQVFVVSLIIGVSIDINQVGLKRLSEIEIDNILVPFSTIKIDSNTAVSLFKLVNVCLAGEENERLIPATYFETRMPEDMMVATIQALAYSSGVSKPKSTETRNNEAIKLPAIKLEEEKENFCYDFPLDCKAVFYCTHSAESYIPNGGEARVDGKRGLVNKVAEKLAEEVEKRGLNSQYIDTIHDYPEYSKSYTNSRATVKKIVSSEEKVLALFDIHRDSIPGITSAHTVKINGKESACILIVVGTDERKPHPEWRKNLRFAQEIYSQGEKMYPGLIRGIRTKAGTYNQEYHEKALLLEFGSDYNTLEEATYAAELFADIIAEVLIKDV